MGTMTLDELEELWQGLTEGARGILLAGKVTLSDVALLAKSPEMTVDRMMDWVARKYPRRRDQLVTRIPQIGTVIKTFEVAKDLLRRVAAKSVQTFDAFMSSELTLEQVRYAFATNMGSRSLRHFCRIDHPDAYKCVRVERRQARQDGSRTRAHRFFVKPHRSRMSTLFMRRSEPGRGVPSVHISVAGYGTDGRPLASTHIEF